jgi:hypothetical protein
VIGRVDAGRLVSIAEFFAGPSSPYPRRLARHLRWRDWERRVRSLERQVAKAERDVAVGGPGFAAAVDRLAALTLELDAVRWGR